MNAVALHWKIYSDTEGKPTGHPMGGNPPLWSLSLLPSDNQISITEGTSGYLSNTTLNLAVPLRIPSGHWWLVFYPEIRLGCCGVVGRQPSDTTNYSIAQLVQPEGADDYPTVWTPVLDIPWTTRDFSELTQQDFAFRLEGDIAKGNAIVHPVAFNFSSILLNETSAAQTLTITNTGVQNLVVSGITITGASASMFHVSPGGANPCGSLTPTLVSGGSCEVAVTFTPSLLGAHTATLLVSSSLPAADEVQVVLSGTGAEAVLSVVKGTIGTQFKITGLDFGAKQGKVFIQNDVTKTVTKIAKGNWTIADINCTVNKALRPGIYDVKIMLQPYKTKSPVTLAEGFTMMRPSIDNLSSDNGTVDGRITIFGKFFGTKKGKVYLDYKDKNGLDKKKNCRVESWQMISTTGISQIVFFVPKGIDPGDHSLRILNKIGAAAIPFTIK